MLHSGIIVPTTQPSTINMNHVYQQMVRRKQILNNFKGGIDLVPPMMFPACIPRITVRNAT